VIESIYCLVLLDACRVNCNVCRLVVCVVCLVRLFFTGMSVSSSCISNDQPLPGHSHFRLVYECDELLAMGNCDVTAAPSVCRTIKYDDDSGGMPSDDSDTKQLKSCRPPKWRNNYISAVTGRLRMPA
jgi:hypothetical protein